MSIQTSSLRASTPLKRLTIASILYLVWASIATIVAIVQNRPAEFAGMSTGLPVGQDFLIGNGTALSPSLWWMIPHAILTFLAQRRGRWGMVGVLVLTIFGCVEFVGAMGEPITPAVFNPATF